MLRVRKVRIDFFITDARLAVACSKYDKGGGWVGGAAAMIVFNAVSKARAAIRSHGKMLAGQVRYPWLRWVASTPKTGFTSDERLDPALRRRRRHGDDAHPDAPEEHRGLAHRRRDRRPRGSLPTLERGARR